MTDAEMLERIREITDDTEASYPVRMVRIRSLFVARDHGDDT